MNKIEISRNSKTSVDGKINKRYLVYCVGYGRDGMNCIYHFTAE